MANNFFLNQDPLLFQNPYTRTMESEDTLRKQLNDAMQQYKTLQQTPNLQTDYIGDLDKRLKELDGEISKRLNNNDEYVRLNQELTEMVQKELMSNIKWKLNSNPVAIKNIERQTEIVNNVSHEVENEQRQNLNELNDYVKNYSNITFDDYKKIKSEESSQKTKTVKNENKRTKAATAKNS